MIEVSLFGLPAVRRAGRDVRLSPFQLALLALVFGEGSIPRTRVAELLWGARCDSVLRHRIRTLRHAVHRRIGDEIFEAQADLLIASPVVGSDLRDFEEALRLDRLQSAASLVVDGFARGPVPGLADEYDHWRARFEGRLSDRVLQRAEAKWTLAGGEHDWVAARDAAEAMYVLQPDREASVSRVIEARARVGKLQSAEVAYAEYGATGRDAASSQLTELMETVRALAPYDTTAEMHRDAPFVGRREILGSLRELFDELRASEARFTLISGEAGIGKSRLLREIERYAVLDGIRCLRAHPTELEQQISLNPILDALGAVDLESHLASLGEPWRTVVGSWLPPGSLADPLEDLPAVEEKSLSRRLFDGFSLLLNRLAEEQATLLLLDDLQWADTTTVTLLQFFQRRWPEARFGVVAAARTEMSGHARPVRIFEEGEGPRPVRSWDLDDLEEADARELLLSMGEARISEGEAEKLIALAGLHPLYLTEVARDYLAGRLSLPDGLSRDTYVPISIRQILQARTHQLSATGERVASLLAIATRAVRLNSLASLLDLGLDEVADAAEELRDRGLVGVDRDRISITHDLFRSGLYNQMGDSRRAVLHLKVGNYLASEQPEEASGELAIHFDRAGEPQLSAKYARRAADRAFERGAMAEAAHFYELVTKNEEQPEARAQATSRLAVSLHLSRDVGKANPALELAATRLRAVGRYDLALRMDVRRVEGLAEAGDTSVDDLIDRLTVIKSEAAAQEDWEAVALALDVELQRLQLAERLDEVRRLRPQFEEVIHKGSPSASAEAHLGLAVGLLLDEPGAAVAAARTAVRLTEHMTADRRLKALNRLLLVFTQQGLFAIDECQAHIAEAAGLAEASGDLMQKFSFESNLGVAHLDSGELEKAQVHFARGEKILGSADMTFARVNLACNLGELAITRGDYDEAASSYRIARSLTGLALPKYREDLVRCGLGICALETGALAEARTLAQQLGDPPDDWYYDPTIFLQFRTRLLERRGLTGEAIDLLDSACSNLEGRLVLAWLKLRLMQIRLMRKRRAKDPVRLAKEALDICLERKLPTREQQFRALLDQ